MKHFIKAQAKFLITVLTLVVLLGVGATTAFVHTTTTPVDNRFDPVELNTKIEENVGSNGDKQVRIANIGKSDAYVRARIMVSGIEPSNVRISTNSNAKQADAAEGTILLVMPNAGDGKDWQRTGASITGYTDDWYYFCRELPGTEIQPNPDTDELRKTSPLLLKVFFGKGVDPQKITVTISHESVLAVPGDQNAAAAIETVFNTHK